MLSCCSKHLLRVYLGIFHGWRFSAGLASLHSTLQLLYFSRVIVQHNNAFCVSKGCGHHLASRWLCLELLWPGGPRPYTLTTLSFIFPGSSTVTRCKRKSSFDIKRFNKGLHTDALVAIYSSLRDLGTQQAFSLRIPK